MNRWLPFEELKVIDDHRVGRIERISLLKLSPRGAPQHQCGGSDCPEVLLYAVW